MPVQTKTPTFTSGIDHSYELHENYMQDGVPTFQFRKRSGEINWRKICALDVDRIARELDFVTLQEYISTVTFCDIASVPDVDCQVVKLFKLAQFTIEYLLHSQEYLQSVLCEYEAKVESNDKEKSSFQHKIEELEADVIKLKDENKKRRKMIQQQQMLIEAGASSYYQCPHCEKAFMNASFLQAHMQRRHPGCANYIGDIIAHSQNEQARLGKELKMLEKNLKSEREIFNEKLLKAEEEKRAWTEQSLRDMAEWKVREEDRMNKELEKMQQSFLEEMDSLKKKEETYRSQIAELQTSMDLRKSNLGDLVDDLEGEKQRLREYEYRMASLEELNSMKDDQIAKLNRTLNKLHGKSASTDEHEKMLRDQEERIQSLQAQLLKKPSISRVSKIQDELDNIHKMMSEESEMSEESMDGDQYGRLRASQISSMKPKIVNHLMGMLEEKLRSSGVDPAAPGISSATLSRKLMVLKTERQQTAQAIPDYYQIRESTRRTLVEEAGKLSRNTRASKRRTDSNMSRSVTFESPGAKRRTTVSAEEPRNRNGLFQRGGSDFTQSQRSRSVPPTGGEALGYERRTQSGRGTPVRDTSFSYQPPQSIRPSTKENNRQTTAQSSPILSPAPRSSGDVFHPPSSPNFGASSRQVESSPRVKFSPRTQEDHPSGLEIPTPVPRGGQKKQSSSPVQSDQDDISDWDDVSEILAVDEHDTKQDKQRSVKDLKKTLEKNLNQPKKKPPAGAVQLLPRNETAVEEFHHSEDDDTFSISSLENNHVKEGQQPSASGGGLRKSVASNSSNTQGTSVWGSGQKNKPDIDLDEFDLDDVIDDFDR